MAVATLDGVLTSLRTLGEEKLAALDVTYAFELAWVRSLLASAAPSAAAAREEAADADGESGPQDKENEAPAKRGRGRTKKAAPARRGGRRVASKVPAEPMEQEAAEITSTEAEDVGEAHEQAPEVGAPLGAVPEGDEAVDDGGANTPVPPSAKRAKPSPAPEKEAEEPLAEAMVPAVEEVVTPAPAMGLPACTPQASYRSSLRRSARPSTRPSLRCSARCSARRSAVPAPSPAPLQMEASAEKAAAEEPMQMDAAEAEEEAPAHVEAEPPVPLCTPRVGVADSAARQQGELTPVVVELCRAGLAAPGSAARRASLGDTHATPLAELNQQLATAAKTVSTRRRRPRTPAREAPFPVAGTINLLYGAPAEDALEFKLEPPDMGEDTPRLPGATTPASIFASASKRVEGKKSSPQAAAAQPAAPTPPSSQPQLAPQQLQHGEVVPETPPEETGGFGSPVDTAQPGGTAKAEVPAPAPAAEEQEQAQIQGEAEGQGEEGVAVGSQAEDGDTPSTASRGNMVTGVSSFVPLVKAAALAVPPPAAGKAPVKVKALEAANAARRQEEAKAAERARRMEVIKQRREAVKQGQRQQPPPAPARTGLGTPVLGKPSRLAGKPVHGPSRLGQPAGAGKAVKVEPVKPSAADLAAQRREKEEAERAERQEKMRRMEEQMAKIKKEKQEREAARLAEKTTTAPALQSPPCKASATASPPVDASYEISPYKSGSDSDEEDDYRRARKPVPRWAAAPALAAALAGQAGMDPDEIFKQKHIKTCSLDDMFRDNPAPAGAKPKNYARRGSSGNWLQDRVTWQEELAYKKVMGFRAFA
eukprot:jgi/Tetstr1/456080/TSEL_042850.t1